MSVRAKMARPILKWAGGKRQILHKIRRRFPADWSDEANDYHEPFFGGGAVFFDLAPSGGTINDVNPRLYRFYKQVKEDPEALIRENRKHQDEHSEDYYYEARDRFNELRNADNRLEEASLLLYLNRTCYNGLYRENQSGEFNVPIGDQKSTVDVVRGTEIRDASQALQGVEINCKDFGCVVNKAEPGDLVYMDPPYKPVSDTANFAEYTQEGFDHEDQMRLRDVALELVENDVHTIISNSPPAANLYDPDEVEKVPDDTFWTEPLDDVRRSINCNGEDRTGATEIVITSVAPGDRLNSIESYAEVE